MEPAPAPASEEEEPPPSTGILFLRGIKIHWRLIVLIVWPLVCALIFIAGTQSELRCAYVVLLMAIYWVCEVLPLGITSLLPIALFPALDILDTETSANAYINSTTILFVCSIFLAFAIQTSNLHRRIALNVILLIGTTHLRLTFGFMFVTMFVSFWIVNTAATAMMAPVVLAVLNEMEGSNLVRVYLPDTGKNEPLYPSRTTRAYFFGIAYASSIGGIATLIGTGTNITYAGMMHERFPDSPETGFGEWVGCWAPLAILMTFFTWAGLCWMYLGLFRKTGMDPEVLRMKTESKEEAEKAAQIARKVVNERLMELGKFSWAEGWVTALFICLLILWVLLEPSWMDGWGKLMSDKSVQNCVPAVLVILLLFAIPMTPSIVYCLSKDPEKRPVVQEPAILTWDYAESKMMWGLLFLVGSGFALSKASDTSGMSKMVGKALGAMDVLPPLLVMFIVCLVASIITEFTSNVAVANVILPVMAELAVAIKINPVYLMMPVAICCSWAFMLPVGTPPNALVAGYVNIRTTDMILAGIIPKVVTLLISVFLFVSYGLLIYPDLTTYPAWASTYKHT